MAVDQIEAYRECDVDADQIDDAGVVRIDLKIAKTVLEHIIQRQQHGENTGNDENLSREAHPALDLFGNGGPENAGRAEEQDQNQDRERHGIAES